MAADDFNPFSDGYTERLKSHDARQDTRSAIAKRCYEGGMSRDEAQCMAIALRAIGAIEKSERDRQRDELDLAAYRRLNEYLAAMKKQGTTGIERASDTPPPPMAPGRPTSSG